MQLNRLFFTLIICALFSSPLWALTSDKDKPVEIEADSFKLDDTKKVTIYSGNVVITQGSMEIQADKVTIYGTRGQLNKIIATGNPAKLKQQPDGNEEVIRGKANRFEYIASKAILVLTNNATLWQGGSTFSSDKIIYDSKRSIVKAGNKNSSSTRVKVTLEPAKKP